MSCQKLIEFSTYFPEILLNNDFIKIFLSSRIAFILWSIWEITFLYQPKLKWQSKKDSSFQSEWLVGWETRRKCAAFSQTSPDDRHSEWSEESFKKRNFSLTINSWRWKQSKKSINKLICDLKTVIDVKTSYTIRYD